MQKVLLDLEMQPIRDNQAKKLSGGQKRRLSVGVAVLGNPKVRGMELLPGDRDGIIPREQGQNYSQLGVADPRLGLSCQNQLMCKMQKLFL